jgi:hypothetical protein
LIFHSRLSTLNDYATTAQLLFADSVSMGRLHLRLLRKFSVCLASGLVLSFGARGGDVVSAGNPYEPIAMRNVFGLNPVTIPPPFPPEDAQLPKITPNGITSIFGRLQVLFKVSPQPGQKEAKDMFYILSEGQREDGIEVLRIDEQAELVTFNNHGIVQEITLSYALKANSPAISGGGGGSGGRNAGRSIPSRSGGSRGTGSQNRDAGGGPSS